MRKTYPAYIMWFFDACACIGWWLFLFGMRQTEEEWRWANFGPIDGWEWEDDDDEASK